MAQHHPAGLDSKLFAVSRSHVHCAVCRLCWGCLCRHTSRSAASEFESVLEAWESAAAAVLQREAILAQVLQIQSALSLQYELDLTVQQMRQVLWAFLAAEQQVQLAAIGLADATGEELRVDCCAYPPAHTRLGWAQLQEMLTAYSVV